MQLRKFLFGFGPPSPIEPLKMLKDDTLAAWPAFSPDGSRLAAAGTRLSVWDLWSLKKVVGIPLDNPAPDFRMVAWSASNLLAVVDEGGKRMQILDGANELKVAKVLDLEKTGPVVDFAFNPDGSRLLVAHSSNDDDDTPNAAVYDTSSWEKVSLRTGLRNDVVAWFCEDIVVAGHSRPSGFLSYVRFNPLDPTVPEPRCITRAGASRVRMIACPGKDMIVIASQGIVEERVTRVRLINATHSSNAVTKVVDVPGRLGWGMRFVGHYLAMCLTNQNGQYIKLLDFATGVFHKETFSCRYSSGMGVSLDGKQLVVTHDKNIFTYRIQGIE